LGGKVREISTIQQLLDFNRQCDCHNCLTFLDHLEPCVFERLWRLPPAIYGQVPRRSSIITTGYAYAGRTCVASSALADILLIPGTSSVKHLRENLNAATLHIPSEMIADLDSIGGGAAQ
jgi:hypothetical protein